MQIVASNSDVEAAFAAYDAAMLRQVQLYAGAASSDTATNLSDRCAASIEVARRWKNFLDVFAASDADTPNSAPAT